MRYVIIGDLHCREIWKNIVAKELNNCDKIIFLGDITVPRDVKLDDPTDACSFLYEVLNFKDEHPDQVVILRGNHDNQALGYYWARCYPQDHPKVQQYWQTDDVTNWFLNNTQWIYRIPDTNIVCSHAGCSTVFLDNAYNYLRLIKKIYYKGIPVPYSWIIDQLNNLEPCELFGFTDDNPYDYNGTSKCQPCTWIRPETLIDYNPEGIVQVVGHTPVSEHIFNIENKIWCCDALGLDNPEYLVIKDGNFKICNV